MKAIHNKKQWTSLIFILVLLLGLHPTACVFGQNKDKNMEEALQSLPGDLEIDNDQPQQYYVSTKQYNRDIYGNFMNKLHISGYLTRGNPDGTVNWHDVNMAESNSLEAEFPKGAKQEYMEGFSYIPGDNMMLDSSFPGFPAGTNAIYAKNLVWDWMAIEAFAWEYFDSLELNVTFSASLINGVVDLDNVGFFENRDVKLTWRGISQVNNELCAMIEYRTFNNTLGLENEQMNMKGRSHYWGIVWVSLKDKQIEYAELYEDVVIDMKMAGMPQNMIINAMREIVYEEQNIDL